MVTSHSFHCTAGGGLIMVGDGINDAPALAAATVGAVLAQRASGTAIAVADVLLLQDNISGLPFCIAKSHQTTSLVHKMPSSLSSTFHLFSCAWFFWYEGCYLHYSCPFCSFSYMTCFWQVKQNVALALSSIVLASLTSVLGFLPLWLTV